MTTKTLQRKIDHSIDLLRRAEPLALRMHPDGFHLAFSGGKDSQVLYHIAQMAGVKFKAHMQVTTIDPPELMAFVRNNYPEVELHRPPLNFYQLLEKKSILPTRKVRWCCEKLKEHAGKDKVTLTGVRAAESTRRASRAEVERANANKARRKQYDDPDVLFGATDEMLHQCVKGSDRIVISPLFRWTDYDVWNFIRSNGIEYCKLYDEGCHRIGCIFCPMASTREKQAQRIRYPGFERAFKKSIQRIIENNGYGNRHNATADEVFDWYLSNEPMNTYFGMLRNQTKLEL
ncbi:phosphoadenosine phosphosulfate reductase family protein [uncultured Rikenella sp.]|uniref:phosphoadenosine phosphosulfate reductase family protein n=1 Tax=uncultured Rikenella sp. TaxID=368003 RepID=UPI0025F07B5A|nr:phosphoadenosine phosphosulfate reductase family protein [uncultured Rikenella sp.]